MDQGGGTLGLAEADGWLGKSRGCWKIIVGKREGSDG